MVAVRATFFGEEGGVVVWLGEAETEREEGTTVVRRGGETEGEQRTRSRERESGCSQGTPRDSDWGGSAVQW